MSYRDLQPVRDDGKLDAPALFDAACQYANFLWHERLPARAILALCRALYLKPGDLPPETRQPYAAYVWLLVCDDGCGFLGNPRISFAHQATRMPVSDSLKRARAWALWHLTRHTRPELPPDPLMKENPPAIEDLVSRLDEQGLSKEGSDLKALMETDPLTVLQESGSETSVPDSSRGSPDSV